MEEKKRDMVLEAKDVEVINRFFTHFNIDIPGYLKDANVVFETTQNFETETILKLALTKAVVESKVSIEQLDELFVPVVKACGEMAYNLQFDRDLVDVIGQDEKDLTRSPQASQESPETPQIQSVSQVQQKDS